MQILEKKNLALADVQVIRYKRFPDKRGYFTEVFRKNDMAGFAPFVQTNESHSRPGVIRGLHFQWNPYVGKLVRTVYGHMVDLVLDIRKNSPTFGKIIGYDMPQSEENDFAEWIWIPPGFAHGNFYKKETTIEYFCTGEYNPKSEAGVCPLASDIDWSLCDSNLREQFQSLAGSGQYLISDKDRDGFTVTGWAKDPRSANFVYQPHD